MISKLTIDNYALIDKSIIEFKEGFTVITGETGAGKSIMLDALGLLRGARADSKVIGSKERKVVVEAIFSNPTPSLEKIFNENGLDWDNRELIIRREISPTGKSRGFINDSPVNLTVLSSISEVLLDIHGQHNNSSLVKPMEQLAIIDSFGETTPLLIDYQNTFRNYITLRNRIKKIKNNISEAKQNKDFIMFRLEQLDKLKPKRGELASLEREAEILENADRINMALKESINIIDGDSSSVLPSLHNAYTIIENLNFDLLDHSGNDNLKERLNSVKIELKDIANTLDHYSEKIFSDAARLEKVQSRIGNIYEIMKRFKVKDEDELVDLYLKLREELKIITESNINTAALESQLKDLAKELKEKAELLSAERIKTSKEFSDIIMERLRPLGLPNINFKVDIQKGKMTAEGQDIITFNCSFNKNHPIQPLSEIASGGEIARVFLVVKSMMAQSMNLPTIIFDEIDTGVSGEIAHKMGNMMREMSSSIQVLAVTHLPQVAANGDFHLKVYKADNREKTVSNIKELTKEERIKEIAGMLSGTTINEVALENAKVLLQSI